MNKIILIFLISLGCALSFSVSASELDDLKAELAVQKEQIAKQQVLLERLEKRIAEQENKRSKQTVTSSTPTSSIPSAVAASTEAPPVDYGQIGPISYPKTSAASKMLPDISLIGSFAAAVFEDDPGENGHNPSRTGFNLQEIELGIQSVVDPYVRADVFLSFHEEGVELEEGYLTTLSLPKGFQIRGGKMKMPFGRFNQTHLEKWSFVDDPLISNIIFGGEGFNELALVPSYLFPTPFFFQLEAGISQGESEGNFDGASKGDMAYSGRLSASFDLDDTTFLLGSSFATGFNASGDDNRTDVYGGDFLVKWKPDPNKGISWQTEYIHRHRQVPRDNQNIGGIYTELLGQWSKRWQAGARFDFVGLPSMGSQQWRMGPMLKFMPSEFLSLRAQYEFDDATASDGNQAGYLQATFNVGPHGAHKF